MMKICLVIFCFLLSFTGNSQEDQKLSYSVNSEKDQQLIFVNCRKVENAEECSFLRISELIATRLNSASLPYLVSENEELILSLRLLFKPEGNISSQGSIIYNPNQKTYLEFESVVKEIPNVLPELNSKGDTVSQSFDAVLIYKYVSGKFQFIEFTKDIKPEYAISLRYPVYPKCKAGSETEKLAKCLKSKLRRHISKNFERKNLNSLIYFSGQTLRTVAYFEFTPQGTISIKRIEGANEISLEKEIKRIISIIPKLTSPGYMGPKPISVPFRLPIAIVY